MCKKKQHLTRGDATAFHMRTIFKRGLKGERFYVYLCQQCNRWHVTTRGAFVHPDESQVLKLLLSKITIGGGGYKTKRVSKRKCKHRIIIDGFDYYVIHNKRKKGVESIKILDVIKL